jgi:predicted phosphodiesterase
MKWIKRVFFTLLSLAALYGAGRLGVVAYDSHLLLERQPYLQMQTLDSVTLKWQTPEAEIGCVTYGDEGHPKRICETTKTQKHRLRVSGLQPATRYRYAVASASLRIDNEGRAFTTLSDRPDERELIWVIGDSGKPGPDQERVLQQMQKQVLSGDIDLWLLLGDNAYYSGTQKQYNAALFGPYRELLKRLVPWAVNGNHDARRWAFYNIFEFPENGESGGVASHSEKFYAIESGNVHIVMLDSETAELEKNGAMARWLEKDLSQTEKPFIIAAFHHPPYTDGGHDSDDEHDSGGRMTNIRENIVPILEQHDVDLVLSGHSHVYERSRLMQGHYGLSSSFDAARHIVNADDHIYCKSAEKKPFAGTLYNVMGSSSKLNRAALEHPALPFSFQKMGSLLLEITPKRLDAKFITIDGEIGDHYSIVKDDRLCR